MNAPVTNLDFNKVDSLLELILCVVYNALFKATKDHLKSLDRIQDNDLFDWQISNCLEQPQLKDSIIKDFKPVELILESQFCIYRLKMGDLDCNCSLKLLLIGAINDQNTIAAIFYLDGLGWGVYRELLKKALLNTEISTMIDWLCLYQTLRSSAIDQWIINPDNVIEANEFYKLLTNKITNKIKQERN